MTKDELIEKFVIAAEKQKHALKTGGWGHAGWCNFQHSSCLKCNCGVADLQTVLKLYEENLRGYKIMNIKKKIK